MAAHDDEGNLSFDANRGAPHPDAGIGLAAWMHRVADELDRTEEDSDPNAVHDLRVALRRCISIADIHMAVDPLEIWREMRKAARRLFKRLGELRDVQIMKNWIGSLAAEQNPAGMQVRAYLDDRETKLRDGAFEAIKAFDRGKWRKWQNRLARRSLPAQLESPVFQQFAVERWQAAYDLQRQALKNHSHASFHRLRVGLKRFRYTVENFLPRRHEMWGRDLGLLQDALGEYHDLFVLWRTALHLGALADRELRAQWRSRIEAESRTRLLLYRSRTVGEESLWPIWRAGLPRNQELKKAAEERIRIWASCRDPEFARTLTLADLSLQMFDGLEREKIITLTGATDLRSALYAAAIMCNVGPKSSVKNTGKSSFRLIKRTGSPLGFPARSHELAALIVRYRRGMVDRHVTRRLADITEEERMALRFGTAILCLADALTGKGNQPIRHFELSKMSDALTISVEGYSEESATARKVAAARHPLEVACRLPVIIRALPK